MDPVTLIVELATGLVLDVACGAPSDLEPRPGCELVLRDGLAGEAWKGWTRSPSGDWVDPSTLAPGSVETLDSYARLRSWEIETGGVDLGGQRIATDRSSQGMIDRAINLLDKDASLAQVEFDTGIPVSAGDPILTLSRDACLTLGLLVGRHVQGTFAKRAAVLRGLRAGTITDRAGVDAVFAAGG
ncbi:MULTISPECIES: hypothetical protein [Methylobacterium]|uniref:DUF4376 domain-containing protein n=1 Tax=Methylobacterium TaxID=407 RepID=UPI00272ECC98|nr:hypothetical protein [Methylobacterium sp.]